MSVKQRGSLVCAAVLTAGLAASIVPAAPASAHGDGQCGIYPIAHRGDQVNYDEDTIRAVTAFPHSETDLRVTKDGHFVLMHDSNVRRTTNGEGRVEDLTWDYIKTLRTEPHGGRVPSWTKTLRAINESGTVLTTEVKNYATTWTRKQLRQAVRQVRKMRLTDQVYLGGYARAYPVLQEVALDMQLYWRPGDNDRVTAATVAAHNASAALVLPNVLTRKMSRRINRAGAETWARRGKKPSALTTREYWSQIASKRPQGQYTDTPYRYQKWCG